MSWWLWPSIAGVIAAGILVGLLVGYFILRKKGKNPSIILQNKDLTFNVASQSAGNLTSGPQKVDAPEIKAKPVISVDDKVDTYLNQINNLPVVDKDTRVKKSEALIELENNLTIASSTATSNLTKFSTEVWDTKRTEFSLLTEEIRGELTEAYVDMLLANNVVWLVTELGRNSQDLIASYNKLSNKVAERLQRIMPIIRESLK
jgi:hypothetical protein